MLMEKIRAEFFSATAPLDITVLDGEPFKMPPMEHQKRALIKGRDKPAFAYLMEQGTGKTKTLIDDAAHNYRTGKIDALIVVAPNAVKGNWVAWDGFDEVTNHMADDILTHKFVFNSDAKADELRAWKRMEERARKEPALIIVAVNYEALLVKRCFNFLEDLTSKMRTMIVLDESTKIKKAGSQRTKLALKIRKNCVMARILTGTVAVKSPLDLYSQFNFLDPAILGFNSFYAFRNHFANLGGFQGKQVLSYKNLDELADLIAPYSYRCTKKEALKDLPEKIYMPTRRVKMTEEQVEAYRSMKEEFRVQTVDGEIAAPIVLTQIMRLQQITGGYVTHGELVVELVPPERNPKFVEALDIIHESPGQCIVWSRFTPEIDGFCRLLEANGISFRRFDGSTSPEDRLAAKRDFLEGKFTVMVANPQVGGQGQDWYTAETVIYLSNSFSTEDRVQSEDRAHRKGTKKPVAYFDIIVQATEDVRVLRVLRGDLKISDMVMSAVQEWNNG